MRFLPLLAALLALACLNPGKGKTAYVGATLFDGSGAEFDAEVIASKRSEVELQVLERREVDRELPFRLEVGVALPKGDRQKWLVEKLTELGVTTLVPLVTERGVARPPYQRSLARLLGAEQRELRRRASRS